jgi:hypothetical protein
MRVEQFIQRIEAEQIKFARDALEKPSNRTEYGYGYAAGVYAGLKMAGDLLLNILAEKERKDSIL